MSQHGQLKHDLKVKTRPNMVSNVCSKQKEYNKLETIIKLFLVDYIDPDMICIIVILYNNYEKRTKHYGR